MVSINTNSTQMAAIARLTQMSGVMNRSMERLATGLKINRASDDPAGMMAVTGMTADQKAIQAQLEALDRAQYQTNAREGVASTVSDMASSLNALAVGAANTGGTSKEEREAMQMEADSIVQAMDHVSSSASFNGQPVGGGYDSRSLGQVTDTSTGATYSVADLASGGRLNLVDGDTALAQQVAAAAVSGVANDRGSMGAAQKGDNATRAGLVAQLVELTKVKSSIEDTDYAKESAESIRSQVMMKAAAFVTKMSGQQNATTVLSLVSGTKSGGPAA